MGHQDCNYSGWARLVNMPASCGQNSSVLFTFHAFVGAHLSLGKQSRCTNCKF